MKKQKRVGYQSTGKVDITKPGFKWKHPDAFGALALRFYENPGGANIQELCDAVVEAGFSPQVAVETVGEFMDAVQFQQKRHNN